MPNTPRRFWRLLRFNVLFALWRWTRGTRWHRLTIVPVNYALWAHWESRDGD